MDYKQNRQEQLESQKQEVLTAIKPICEAFGINDYDYIIKDGRETLRIYDTLIGCSYNSISATIEELIGYIFVKIFVKNRGLGAFKNQTLNYIKQYWFKQESEAKK